MEEPYKTYCKNNFELKEKQITQENTTEAKKTVSEGNQSSACIC